MENIRPFYDYFINKHGLDVFDGIKEMIIKKIKSYNSNIEKYMSIKEFNKVYFIFVFEVAIADYWGMNDEQIVKYVKIALGENLIGNLSVSRVKSIHSDAIKEIQKYLKQTEEEVKEMFNNQ